MSTPAQAWKNDPGYDATHARRFELSMQALMPLMRGGRDRVLELGAPGSFSQHFRLSAMPCEFRNVVSDLRYRFPEEPDAHYDGVLCMEVFEHIHDQEADTPTEWRATGTAQLFSEVFRVLKPGGFLFLTTPNACSLNVLEKVLTMQPPMIYRPHVREYAPAEIDQMLRAHGFRIESFITHDCWGGGCSGARRRELEAMLARAACPSPHRGENIFVIARKP